MSKNHEGAWESCLKVIKDNISLQAFKTWFEPIVPVKLDKDVLTIQVPSYFFYEWLEENYITLLRKVVKKQLGADGSLEYSIVMENNNFVIHLEDERLSSQYAKKIMIQQDIKTGKNKEMVDVLSASIILQTYLDREK